MFHQVIVDRGVLVAVIDRHDHYCTWGTEEVHESFRFAIAFTFELWNEIRTQVPCASTEVFPHFI